MVQIEGKYKRTKEEGYNDFLNKLGVNMLLRKAATISNPTMEISKEGDMWKIVTSTTMKTMEIKFKLGESFDESPPDGRKCVTTVTAEGDDVWVTEQKAKDGKGKDVKVRRQFADDGVHVTMECEGVVSKQFYERA